MPDPEQATLTSKPTTLTGLAEQEPTDDRGVTQVLVSSGSTRARFHRQDIHREGTPACGQKLSADHTEWIEKPKGAMERSNADPCPKCYPGVHDV